MNPVLGAALRRGLMIAVLAFAGPFIVARQQGQGWESAIYIGLGALIPVLMARFGGEGIYDSKRAADGNMNASDVPMASPKTDVIKTG